MWKVLDWPSQSHDLNPMEQALHFLKRRLKSETAETNNWKWLQQRLAKASQRKISNVCWCQWVTCSKQVLHARDMQLNTNYYTMLIYSKLICYNTCAEKALAIFHDELSHSKCMLLDSHGVLQVCSQLVPTLQVHVVRPTWRPAGAELAGTHTPSACFWTHVESRRCRASWYSHSKCMLLDPRGVPQVHS